MARARNLRYWQTEVAALWRWRVAVQFAHVKSRSAPLFVGALAKKAKAKNPFFSLRGMREIVDIRRKLKAVVVA